MLRTKKPGNTTCASAWKHRQPTPSTSTFSSKTSESRWKHRRPDWLSDSPSLPEPRKFWVIRQQRLSKCLVLHDTSSHSAHFREVDQMVERLHTEQRAVRVAKVKDMKPFPVIAIGRCFEVVSE